MLKPLDGVEWNRNMVSQLATMNSIDVFADTHVLSSVAMIAEASALAGSGSAAVLGCGRCGEIPLRLLNQTFDVVDLVDIDRDALAAVNQQCKQWNGEKKGYRFHRADLTGMIATVERRAGELVANAVDPIECLEQLGVLLQSTAPKFWAPRQRRHYDFLVCSTVLTQLQALVRQSAEKIYFGRFPEYAPAFLTNKSWCESLWNFARNLEDGFIEHLGSLIRPQGIVYLSETVHVSWLTQLDEQSVATEGGRWITLRTS
ncbi:MAG: hypothetical protein ACREA9_01830, partial [Pyrinomonadaceae bacterium]